MLLSPRLTRGLRNGLVLSATALMVVTLGACKAPLGQSGSGPDVVADSAGEPADRSTTAPDTTPDSTTPDSPTSDGTTPDSTDSGGATSPRAEAGTSEPSVEGGTSESESTSTPEPTRSPAGTAAGSRGAPADGPILIGVTAGGYDQAVAGTGGPLANHAYANFSWSVPQADMISVSAANTKWRDVATAGPGSALHDDIVRWARTLKDRGSVMLAYNHEPEASDRLTLGSAADFVAAWRHVRSIFDQQGATNVVWTWQMTAWSFRVGSDSEQDAAKWYPGDDVVDVVGADAYNWMTCRGGTSGGYAELQEMGDSVLDFARAHGKKAAFPEFGSHANPNRAQWLRNAHQYFVDNKDVVTAAFYFNRPPPEAPARNAGCEWTLTTAAEYGALHHMVEDAAHFTV